VKVLGSGAFTAGRNEIIWNGTDASGQAVASGVYHVRMRTASGEQGARVTLLR
jgi:flagellar hook assembly protein FlgD